MQYDRLQLPLPFQHRPRFDARGFHCRLPPTERHWPGSDADWPERRLALFGPEGCGKSHLLHIWAERTGRGRTVRPGADGSGLRCLPDGGLGTG